MEFEPRYSRGEKSTLASTNITSSHSTASNFDDCIIIRFCNAETNQKRKKAIPIAKLNEPHLKKLSRALFKIKQNQEIGIYRDANFSTRFDLWEFYNKSEDFIKMNYDGLKLYIRKEEGKPSSKLEVFREMLGKDLVRYFLKKKLKGVDIESAFGDSKVSAEFSKKVFEIFQSGFDEQK